MGFIGLVRVSVRVRVTWQLNDSIAAQLWGLGVR